MPPITHSIIHTICLLSRKDGSKKRFVSRSTLILAALSLGWGQERKESVDSVEFYTPVFMDREVSHVCHQSPWEFWG
jgi:hypothetical protein